MPAIDYAKELMEAAQRHAARLAAQDNRNARLLAAALSCYQEYAWLEKDYEEWIEENSLGGRTYREYR